MFQITKFIKTQPILTFVDVLVSITDLHQKMKLILVLPVIGTMRT